MPRPYGWTNRRKLAPNLLMSQRPRTTKPMRRMFLCNCAPGDVVEDVYVITNKQLSAASNGKLYIKAFLSDKTAQVPARMWNATKPIFDALPSSGFIRIRGRVENYQTNLQFIIEQVFEAKDGTYDAADLIPTTTKDVKQMCERLHTLLRTIRNKHLLALINAYLDDQRLMDRFCKAPAAMSFHHAFLGGLLEHTLNAIEVANAICPFYPTLNRDLVIAGLFLHDIAKTWELEYDCAFSYSNSGQLVGHIVKSAIWVERKRDAAQKTLGEPIPSELIDVLQHIILSHHGPLENAFGSAKTPSTPEAMMVHFIDEIDAKLMLALQATRGETNGEGPWTEYLKAFQGRLYRPDVAPADDGASNTPPEEPSIPAHFTDGKVALTNPMFQVETKR